jgi:hypothetical protein
MRQQLAKFLILSPLFCACSPNSTGSPLQSDRSDEVSVWPAPTEEEQGSSAKDNPWLISSGGEGALSEKESPSAPTAESTGASPEPEGMGGHQVAGSGAKASGTVEGEDVESAEEEPLAEARPTELARLIFREYKEGVGSDKRIVLVNLGSGIDGACSLLVYANGATEPWRSIAITPLPPPSNAAILCSKTEVSADCTGELPGSPFNGNDALELVCSGEIVDSFGQVGMDPGMAWMDPDDPAISSKDAWLIRCLEEGDQLSTDPFLIEEDWVALSEGESPAEAMQRCGEGPNSGWGGNPL